MWQLRAQRPEYILEKRGVWKVGKEGWGVEAVSRSDR